MGEAAKRTFDIVVSLLLLATLYPVMIVIAMAIRAESAGDPLFRQKRAGRYGKPFTMMKFRTMHLSTDPYGRSPEAGDDPRLTRVGRFLREHSLDELPQLFNVLAGAMSLVGPRPLYVRQAAQWDQRQRRRLDVPPGITGWAQISGRGEIPIEEKIELDLWYVDNRSALLDLKILLATFVGSAAGKGVYERQYSHEQQRERY